MAWMCSATSNDGLVAALLSNGLLKSPPVAAAMRKVDRIWFVPDFHTTSAAYSDLPLSIGHGVTISAPHMHAIMLELLAPYILDNRNCVRVLDIGSGSGYLTTILAQLCSTASSSAGKPKDWKVWGIEHVKALQESSLSSIKTHFPSWVEKGHVNILHGDGRNAAGILASIASTNAVDAVPPVFDVIHVGAAASTIPVGLIDLLNNNGCMVIPVGEANKTQRLLVCHKDQEGRVTEKVNCFVSFVPLTSLSNQLRKL